VAALMKGGWAAAPDDSLPFALQPARAPGRMQRTAAIRKIILENEVI